MSSAGILASRGSFDTPRGRMRESRRLSASPQTSLTNRLSRAPERQMESELILGGIRSHGRRVLNRIHNAVGKAVTRRMASSSIDAWRSSGYVTASVLGDAVAADSVAALDVTISDAAEHSEQVPHAHPQVWKFGCWRPGCRCQIAICKDHVGCEF